MASTTTPPRGRDAAVPEDPADSSGITRTAGLWLAFPVVCAVILAVVLILVFR